VPLVGNKYNLTTNPLHLSHLAHTSQLPGRKIHKEEAYKNMEGGGPGEWGCQHHVPANIMFEAVSSHIIPQTNDSI